MSADGPEWEFVQSGQGRTTWRLPVPGGWIYEVSERDDVGIMVRPRLLFVPWAAQVPGPGGQGLAP